MNIDKIKAPEDLKQDVIRQMEMELSKNNAKYSKKDLDNVHHLCKKPYINKKKSFKVPIAIVSLLFIAIFSGFAYNYFSGIKGDELAFNTKYKGDGIVHIEVENKSHKDLQFTAGILKSWKDNKELLYLNKKGENNIPCVQVDMPLIKGGEKKTIIIDLSEYDYKELEKPIKYNDGFIFVLTNDNFQYGQNWTTAIRFDNEILGSAPNKNNEKTSYLLNEGKNEDNTNLDYIEEIKENFALANPLDELIICSEYNSSVEFFRVCLVSDTGTNIYAMADGTVIKPDYNSYLGNYVIIEHSDDFNTEYRHCSEILVENGEYVKAGDIIAKVGATGRATGSHLNIIAKYKGEYINPALLFNIQKP